MFTQTLVAVVCTKFNAVLEVIVEQEINVRVPPVAVKLLFRLNSKTYDVPVHVIFFQLKVTLTDLLIFDVFAGAFKVVPVKFVRKLQTFVESIGLGDVDVLT